VKSSKPAALDCIF